MARVPPTIAPRTTRGNRSDHRMLAWPGSTEPPSSARSTVPGAMCTGPTSTPTAALRTRTPAPATAHIQGSLGSPARGTGLARALTPSTSGRLLLELQYVRRDRLQEVDEPRAPARSDVVVDLHDLARLHRADHAPARPRRYRA